MKISYINQNKPPQSFDAKEITIGREDDNTLQLLSEGISRHHGRIFCDENNVWYIEDFGSTNGIKVNGEKISMPVRLQENDVIDFFQEKLQVSELNEYTNIPDPKSTDTAIISISDIVSSENSSGITVDPIVIEPVIQMQPESISLSPVKEEKNISEKEPELEKIADFIHQNTSNLFSANKKEKKIADSQNTSKEKYKFGNKLFYVTLVMAVIVIGAFVIKILEDKNKPLKRTAEPTAKEYPLYLTYIKENITKDNVFRFTLNIENGIAKFSVDDLKSQLRYGPISKPVSESEMQRLKQTIKESNFMKLDSVPAGLLHNSDREFKELDIHYGPQSNKISLMNRPAPREFIDVEEALNIFAENCNMSTISLSPAELQQIAADSYRIACDRFANYETNLGNLKEAIHNFTLTIEYLSGISPEPEIRRDAIDKVQRATDIRTKLINQYKSQYMTMINQSNLEGAKNSLLALISLYDENSKEYTFAKQRLIKIDIIRRRLKTSK